MAHGRKNNGDHVFPLWLGSENQQRHFRPAVPREGGRDRDGERGGETEREGEKGGESGRGGGGRERERERAHECTPGQPAVPQPFPQTLG